MRIFYPFLDQSYLENRPYDFFNFLYGGPENHEEEDGIVGFHRKTHFMRILVHLCEF
jgi:hypothetical protein